MNRPKHLCLVIALFILGTTIASPAQSQKARATGVATKKTNSPWERVVMVGASVSAGFTASEPLGGHKTEQLRLHRYIDAALVAPHQPIENLGTSLFFIQPEAAGRQQIDAALQSKPTLVLGIDFLFWFCYGEGDTDAQRSARFERGLKLLEAVQCPLVVGDIPDASAARGTMLRPDQFPSAKAMASANQRLKAWAATRPQVVVVPLSKIMRTIADNQSLTIHGHNWAAGKTRIFLQTDSLHPSVGGCAVLTLAVLDAIQSARPNLAANGIRWDPKEIFQTGYKASQVTTTAKRE